MAGQRVAVRYPDAATMVAKRAGRTPFEDVVNMIMRDEGVSRSEAMSRARRQEPLKYVAYQEAWLGFGAALPFNLLRRAALPRPTRFH